jgi:hypothetical protein
VSDLTAPVTHQDQGLQKNESSSSATPSVVNGPENLRFQAVSNLWVTDPMVISQPLVAHGVGGQDVDERYEIEVERLTNQAIWFLTNPKVWFPVPTQIFIRITSQAEKALDPLSRSNPPGPACLKEHCGLPPHWSFASFNGSKHAAPDKAAWQIPTPPHRPTTNTYSHSSCYPIPSTSHC